MVVKRNQIEQMISLKKLYLTNFQIGDQLDIGLQTVGKYLEKYMPNYKKYLINRIGRKKIREIKNKSNLERLRKKYENKRITSQEACIVSLCEPARNLYDEYFDIQEIREKQYKITSAIKEICIRLFKINRSRSPKLILATAIYLCTSLSLNPVSELLNISPSSICILLKLIKIKKNPKMIAKCEN